MAFKTPNYTSSKTTCNIWQKIWHSTNTYDTLIPLYRACKIFGLAPYSFKKVDAKYRYVTTKLEISYSILFLLCYIAFFYYASHNNNQVELLLNDKHSKVANFIDTFQWYATLFVMIILISLNCYKQNILMKALEKMVAVDSQIENLGLRIDHYKAKKCVAVNVIWQITIYIVMERLNCSLFLTEMRITSLICYTICYIPLLVGGFVKGQFIVLILLLKYRFAAINNKLLGLTKEKRMHYLKIHPEIQLVQQSSKRTQYIVSTTKRIHGQLCYVGRLINNAFSLQILCIIGYNFISFTAHAYFCIESYIKIYIENQSLDLALGTTTMWAVVKLGVLFHLTFTCNQTKNEVLKSATIIHKIKNRFESEIIDEIIAFSKQVLHWNFKFTAFDLFDIDMSVFYMMLTSAATYLVILIQMDVAINQNFRLNFGNNTFRLG